MVDFYKLSSMSLWSNLVQLYTGLMASMVCVVPTELQAPLSPSHQLFSHVGGCLIVQKSLQPHDPQCCSLPCDEYCKGLWAVGAVNHWFQLHCWTNWRTSRLLYRVSHWFSRVINWLVSLLPGYCLHYWAAPHTANTVVMVLSLIQLCFYRLKVQNVRQEMPRSSQCPTPFWQFRQQTFDQFTMYWPYCFSCCILNWLPFTWEVCNFQITSLLWPVSFKSPSVPQICKYSNNQLNIQNTIFQHVFLFQSAVVYTLTSVLLSQNWKPHICIDFNTIYFTGSSLSAALFCHKW